MFGISFMLCLGHRSPAVCVALLLRLVKVSDDGKQDLRKRLLQRVSQADRGWVDAKKSAKR